MSTRNETGSDWTPSADLAALATTAPEDYRNGMRHFAAGVSVVTAADGQARAGLTATAVCSVTADPPRLVVFVNKAVAAAEIIRASGGLCVNLLAADQEEIAKAFAGMIKGVAGEDRFEHGHWGRLASGAPVLDDALVNFDCRVAHIHGESTHYAIFCDVLATRERSGGDALVYLNGGFRSVAQ